MGGLSLLRCKRRLQKMFLKTSSALHPRQPWEHQKKKHCKHTQLQHQHGAEKTSAAKRASCDQSRHALSLMKFVLGKVARTLLCLEEVLRTSSRPLYFLADQVQMLLVLAIGLPSSCTGDSL